MLGELVSGWLRLLATESLYATVVFAVVWMLTRLLRRRGPGLHHALWLLVLLRLVLPPGLDHPLSLGRLVGVLAPGVATSVAVSADSPGIPAADETGRAVDLRHSDHPSGWPPGLAAGWLVGFVLMLAATAARRRRFRRLLAAGAEVCDPELEALIARFGLRRRVRLVSGGEKVSPFTLGWLRPVVWLPATVLADGAAARACLVHELTHVARMDDLWLRLQQLLHAVYFFHPLVWAAGRRLADERERLCDVAAVRLGGMTSTTYAAGMLRVLKLRLAAAPAPALAVRRLEMRLETIVGGRMRSDRGPLPVLAALVVGLVVLPLAGGAAADVPEPPMSPAPDVATAPELVLPVSDARVTAGWGPMRDPFSGEQVQHRGLDLAAPEGTPVVAAAAGVVVVATTEPDQPARGTVVEIDHGNGLRTVYGHLGELTVEPGQRVAAGERIALVGMTGKTTGPHVHFEVRRDGAPVDPAPLLPRTNQ